MQIIDLDSAPVFGMSDIRARKHNFPSKLLLRGQDGSRNNYAVYYGHTDDLTPTPRHRHNFEQIRFPQSGEFEYGPDQVLHANELMNFPDSAYYGPQGATRLPDVHVSVRGARRVP